MSLVLLLSFLLSVVYCTQHFFDSELVHVFDPELTRNYLDSQQYCQTHFINGTLASVNSQIIQQRIQILHNNSGTGTNDSIFWIGLTYNNENCSICNENYSCVGNLRYWDWIIDSDNWFETDPTCCNCNNNCVAIRADLNYTWVDRPCFEAFNSMICQRFISNNPTTNPSDYPSIYPSLFPSKLPTIVPSFVPSVNPSISPTKYPTENPSEAPSNNPSFYPSFLPTIIPSFIPTTVPTLTPVTISDTSKSGVDSTVIIVVSLSSATVILSIILLCFYYVRFYKKKNKSDETDIQLGRVQTLGATAEELAEELAEQSVDKGNNDIFIPGTENTNITTKGNNKSLHNNTDFGDKFEGSNNGIELSNDEDLYHKQNENENSLDIIQDTITDNGITVTNKGEMEGLKKELNKTQIIVEGLNEEVLKNESDSSDEIITENGVPTKGETNENG